MRNGSIDALRFVGALGIILFHCDAPGGWIGLSALPMFVLLLVYYGMQRPTFVGVRRLLSIWLAWSLVYAALKIAQSIVSGAPIVSEFAPWMMLAGPSIHLWFLSFCALFLVVVSGTRSLPENALALLCIAASVAALVIAETVDLPRPFGQWASVVPAGMTGVYMARSKHPAVPALVLALASLAAVLSGAQSLTAQNAIAGFAVAAAVAFPVPQTRLTDMLTGLSLGMYLIHPALIALALYLIPKSSPAFFPLVAAASIVATFMINSLLPALRQAGKRSFQSASRSR
ncbi:MAG: hypothetical protein Tsb0019_31530 [Roseibium sp.]